MALMMLHCSVACYCRQLLPVEVSCCCRCCAECFNAVLLLPLPQIACNALLLGSRSASRDDAAVTVEKGGYDVLVHSISATGEARCMHWNHSRTAAVVAVPDLLNNGAQARLQATCTCQIDED